MARRTPPPPTPEPDADIAALYRLPLTEFIDARNALAARLRKSGDAEGSARVKALPKPSAPAWALNQVYWHARADYDQMIAAGDRLRAEQQRMLAGSTVDSRAAGQERQAAVRRVVERAARLLADSGQPPTEATRQRLAVTADSLATWGSRPEGYVPGRLERELDPPGFAALASLGAPSLRLVKSDRPAPEPTEARVTRRTTRTEPQSAGTEVPEPRRNRTGEETARAKEAARAREAERAREAARAREAERKRLTRALHDAEREARTMASAHQRAAAALSRAEGDADAVAQDVGALERQLVTLRERLERAERARADAAAAATAAERAQAEADEGVAAAKKALLELGEEQPARRR
jgi:hypothetical protein